MPLKQPEKSAEPEPVETPPEKPSPWFVVDDGERPTPAFWGRVQLPDDDAPQDDKEKIR